MKFQVLGLLVLSTLLVSTNAKKVDHYGRKSSQSKRGLEVSTPCNDASHGYDVSSTVSPIDAAYVSSTTPVYGPAETDYLSNYNVFNLYGYKNSYLNGQSFKQTVYSPNAIGGFSKLGGPIVVGSTPSYGDAYYGSTPAYGDVYGVSVTPTVFTGPSHVTVEKHVPVPIVQTHVVKQQVAVPVAVDRPVPVPVDRPVPYPDSHH
uniref:Uncharacterized protein n=1 Tax=Cacopsylla melanoneura TaxID=428564 RepID=A0A8D9FF14_9HEMI